MSNASFALRLQLVVLIVSCSNCSRNTISNSVDPLVPSFPAPAGYFDVTAYGALGDGIADDSPAFQAALDAMNGLGGTLSIPGGVFRLASSIKQTLSGKYPRIVLQGAGSASQILVATGAGVDVFNLQSFGGIVVRDLVFRGTASNNAVECNRLFYFADTGSVAIEDSTFLGIMYGAALIETGNSGVRISGTQFLGDGGAAAPLLYFHEQLFVNIDSTYFIDYGNIGGLSYNKTFVGPMAWVQLGDDNPSTPSVAQIENIHFDEGALRAVWAHPKTKLTGVAIRNVTNFKSRLGSTGVTGLFEKTGTVTIDNAAVMTLSDGNQVVYDFQGCGNVTVSNQSVVAPGGSGTLDADSATQFLHVVNSVFSQVNSEAQVTQIDSDGTAAIVFGTDGLVDPATLVKASTTGRVQQVAPGDPVSEVIGVALEGTTPATGTLRALPKSGYSAGQLFRLYDGVNPLAQFFFSLDGTPTPGVTVDISGDTTAEDVAATIIAAVNSIHGANVLRIAASAGGDSVVALTNDQLGEIGNQRIQNGSFMPAVGMVGGRSNIRVTVIQGQVVSLKSDGVAAISPGDAVTVSDTCAGRITLAGTSGNIVGRALSASGATADALVQVMYGPGPL